MSPVIVLDRDIPFIQDIFSGAGRLVPVPGHEITRETVRDADVLIVRSITRVDQNLLEGSRIQFVGTATAGTDHLDTEFLSAAGIEWGSAPGANAVSVVEYVLAAMSVIARRGSRWLPDLTLGVVGCGEVGGRLARQAEALGMDVMRNDPPREAGEGSNRFVSLDTLLASSDVVSVHVPLTSTGPFPTADLLDADALGRMKPGSLLIQSSRGGTVTESAALAARQSGRLGALVLDVFDREPTPAAEAIATADLATGHIAGYSRDAKRAGAVMMRRAVERHFGGVAENSGDNPGGWPDDVIGRRTIELESEVDRIRPGDPGWFDSLIARVMDIRADDARFRDVMEEANPGRRAKAFHAYRAGYPARFAWSHYQVDSDDPEERRLAAALGFSINRG